ncbi:hypothetical protein HAX54_007342 [Datura stramonium]|uniref:Uncharacterized protein n=1 Tax=Datura stramonium TaxID=4076 RepID=A0ABS8WYD0_DATST|nr:hypothetical protein [Datura stramonium]
MGQVLNHGNTPIIYFDEAFESHEEDPYASILAITTRSGKVVHSKPRMILQEEIHDAKNLHPKVNVAPKEINDEASSEKVNEKCKEGMKLPRAFACKSNLDELADMEEGDPRSFDYYSGK